jgi:hypothetical protein
MPEELRACSEQIGTDKLTCLLAARYRNAIVCERLIRINVGFSPAKYQEVA